jgi:CBS domain containing-hemolysin-like protein
VAVATAVTGAIVATESPLTAVQASNTCVSVAVAAVAALLLLLPLLPLLPLLLSGLACGAVAEAPLTAVHATLGAVIIRPMC